jgi:hypothetical protein
MENILMRSTQLSFLNKLQRQLENITLFMDLSAMKGT